MALTPIQRAPQIVARSWLVQPQFVLRNDKSCTDKPDAGFPLFNENLPSRELLAQRNLSIRADDLDARPGSKGSHSHARIDY